MLPARAASPPRLTGNPEGSGPKPCLYSFQHCEPGSAPMPVRMSSPFGNTTSTPQLAPKWSRWAGGTVSVVLSGGNGVQRNLVLVRNANDGLDLCDRVGPHRRAGQQFVRQIVQQRERVAIRKQFLIAGHHPVHADGGLELLDGGGKTFRGHTWRQCSHVSPVVFLEPCPRASTIHASRDLRGCRANPAKRRLFRGCSA